jgi:O-antigen/teichoic acid export membrane protein
MRLFNTFLKLTVGREGGQTVALLQSSGKILMVQVAGALLLLLNNFAIVKCAGDEAYGSYVSIMIWVNLFSVGAVMGMDDRFIAVVPRFLQTPQERTAFSVLRWALVRVLLFFPVVCALLFLLHKLGLLAGVAGQPAWILFALTGALALLALLVQFLRAINRLLTGQIIDKLARAILSIAILVMLAGVGLGLSTRSLLLIQLATLAVCAVGAGWVLYGVHRRMPRSDAKPFAGNLRPNLAFLAISLLNLLAVRIDLLFLSSSVAPQEVGYYNIAMRFADIIHYPVSILNLIVPTLLSRAWHSGAHRAAHRIIQVAAIVGIIGTTLLLLVIGLFGDSILGLFGRQFAGSYPILLVMGVTCLVTAFTGPLNAVLMVSGRERLSLYCLIVQVMVTAAVCALAVPRWGAAGAAAGVVAGTIVYHFVVTLLFYRLEKVWITPLRIYRGNGAGTSF